MGGVVGSHLAWLRLRGLRPATIDTRNSRLKHLAAALGIAAADLLGATEADLDAWQRKLRLTPGAHSAYISHVQQFYRWAALDGRIDSNPAARLIQPKVPRRVPRPISEDDLTFAVNTACERIRPWLVLAGWAGLRAGEIARLERCDVLDNEHPRVLYIADGKGGAQRVVPMSTKVHQALRGLPSSGYVFRRRDGKPGPNAPWIISGLANRHLHELGIPASIHQCRHRFGTRLYAECGDLRLVQELMGHRSPSTTASYVAYSHEKAVEAIEAMGRDEAA